MSLHKEMFIEAEDEIRCMVGEALIERGFTPNDAEHIADSCDIPDEWLLEATNNKFTSWVDWAKDFHDSFAEP